jgi:hypothetical protein
MDSRFCKSTLSRSGLLVGALLALIAIARLGAATTDTAMLKRIASRVDDRAGRHFHRGVRPGAVRRLAA